jgi:hypothetical protein
MANEETYGKERAQHLERLLKALAVRIAELAAEGKLLDHAGELTKLIGDVRSELFAYEVRVTYDTPEIAESRRIVNELTQDVEQKFDEKPWSPDDEDEPKW